MKASEWFLAVWGFIWIVGTSVDFAFSFGDNKPASIVVESKQTPKEEKKKETIVDDMPKASW